MPGAFLPPFQGSLGWGGYPGFRLPAPPWAMAPVAASRLQVVGDFSGYTVVPRTLEGGFSEEPLLGGGPVVGPGLAACRSDAFAEFARAGAGGLDGGPQRRGHASVFELP